MSCAEASEFHGMPAIAWKSRDGACADRVQQRGFTDTVVWNPAVTLGPGEAWAGAQVLEVTA
jgi:hypothetical protein